MPPSSRHAPSKRLNAQKKPTPRSPRGPYCPAVPRTHETSGLAVDSMNAVYTGDPGHGWPIAQAAIVPVLIVVG